MTWICREIKGRKVFVDLQDVPLLSAHTWKIDKGGYVRRHHERGALHRIILGLLGSPETHVDHINGDKLDNRRCNLRACTREQNMRNMRRHSDNTSGYKGVHWNKQRGKWAAALHKMGKRRLYKLFTLKEDAAKAYDEAAKQHFGEFARLNFPEAA
jgi:hypothetical protein